MAATTDDTYIQTAQPRAGEGVTVVLKDTLLSMQKPGCKEFDSFSQRVSVKSLWKLRNIICCL